VFKSLNGRIFRLPYGDLRNWAISVNPRRLFLGFRSRLQLRQRLLVNHLSRNSSVILQSTLVMGSTHPRNA